MKDFMQVLTDSEKAVFKLRALYNDYGYAQYKMGKFEEYDLYAKNKDYLVSEGVITFTDTDGKLLALKPDVTLSIIKNGKDVSDKLTKVYYNENVYRVSKGTQSFKEIMQVGLECQGQIDDGVITEVLTLAVKSLESISCDYSLEVSGLNVVSYILEKSGISKTGKAEILTALGEKNSQAVSAICESEKVKKAYAEAMLKLTTVYGGVKSTLEEFYALSLGDEFNAELDKLSKILSQVEKVSDKIRLDFSVVSDFNYYNGIVFKGFISGIPTGILSGGQYDNLMSKLGRKSGAIGFAVYLDELEKLKETGVNKQAEDKVTLNVALPKGRLGEKVYAMFENAGFPCPSIKENNRKLIFENEQLRLRYFWVKPSDVAIYVERGAADIGVAGKDILLEYTPDVYELLDLNVGKCHMAVAAKADFKDDRTKTLIVATKFKNIAKSYYASLGRDIDIIQLNGSIELAPILGLSDVIVDIVETGATLKENKLEVVEKFVPISARLIANKANFEFKSKRIEQVRKNLAQQTENN